MEKYDAEKAARVWQRVRGTEPREQAPRQEALGLGALIAGERRAEDVYGRLSRQAQGESGQLYRQLQSLARQQGDCLLGLQRLEGTARVPGISPMKQGQPEALLRLCYAETRQRIQAFYAQAGHPEQGRLFAALAAREEKISMGILEALGSL